MTNVNVSEKIYNPLLVQPLLYKILKTKRPTGDLKQNIQFTTWLLKKNGIRGYIFDAMGNITVDVPNTDGTPSRIAFTCHTDTVDNKIGDNTLHISPDGFVSVLGGGVLGADDGAGMYILMEMILEQVPGRYIFFATEEQGRIGSQAYAMPDHIKICISFDRKGTDNLITHQMGERGCSDAFANSLIAELAQQGLPFVKDPTGSFTDSYSFFTKVPECINLSCGYYNQHTKQEKLDVKFVEDLLDSLINIDWDSLVVERDPTMQVYDSYGDDDGWDWLDKRMGFGKSSTVYTKTTTTTKVYGKAVSDDHDDHDDFDDDDTRGNTATDDLDDGWTANEAEYEQLLDYVQRHPDIAVSILQDYGVIPSDFSVYGGV